MKLWMVLLRKVEQMNKEEFVKRWEEDNGELTKIVQFRGENGKGLFVADEYELEENDVSLFLGNHLVGIVEYKIVESVL